MLLVLLMVLLVMVGLLLLLLVLRLQMEVLLVMAERAGLRRRLRHERLAHRGRLLAG